MICTPTLSARAVGRRGESGTHHGVAEGTNGDMTAVISSCLPILLPGGAVIPAIKAATGLGSPYKQKTNTHVHHYNVKNTRS